MKTFFFQVSFALVAAVGIVAACSGSDSSGDDDADDGGSGAPATGGNGGSSGRPSGGTSGSDAGGSQGGSAGDPGTGGQGDAGPGGGGGDGPGTCASPFTCEGASLYRCSEGDLILEAQCTNTALCNAEAGQCDAPACELGDFRCSGVTLRSCKTDRTDFETADTCATAELCDDDVGECVAPACGATEFRCTGAMLERCNAARTAFEDVLDCGTAALCDGDAGACEVASCTPNAYQCNTATLLRCNASGTSLGIEELCQTAALCNVGAARCDTPACASGQYSCSGATLRVCNAGRTDYEDDDDCATAALCNAPGGTCIAPECVADAYECASNVLRQCKTDRTGFDVIDACSDSTEICQTSPPLCLGPALVPGTDKWVHRTENSFGVQGAWFTVSGMGSSFDAFTSGATGVVCGFGSTAQVVNGNFSTYWGAEIGANLCGESETDPNPGVSHTLTDCPWGSVDRVEGIRFRVTGDMIPPTLNVLFIEEGRASSAYVQITTGAGRYTALISDADTVHDPGNPAVAANVESIAFMVPGIESGTQPFGFCISEVEVVGSLN